MIKYLSCLLYQILTCDNSCLAWCTIFVSLSWIVGVVFENLIDDSFCIVGAPRRRTNDSYIATFKDQEARLSFEMITYPPPDSLSIFDKTLSLNIPIYRNDEHKNLAQYSCEAQKLYMVFCTLILHNQTVFHAGFYDATFKNMDVCQEGGQGDPQHTDSLLLAPHVSLVHTTWKFHMALLELLRAHGCLFTKSLQGRCDRELTKDNTNTRWQHRAEVV